MRSPNPTSASTPTRRAEFVAGLRAELPLLLGVAPFGMSYGAAAVDADLSAGFAQAMSTVIFGGASQLAAVRGFETALPGAAIILTVWLVNLRHLLYSAGLAPHVANLDLRWRALLGYLLTDEAYVVGVTRYREPDDAPFRHWFLFGAMVALWVCWQLTTAIGVFAGAAVPESWSLDFAIVVTFIAMVVPAMRDRPSLAAAVAAGAVATLGFRWEYGTGLFAGAIAGIAAGFALERALGVSEPPAEPDGIVST